MQIQSIEKIDPKIAKAIAGITKLHIKFINPEHFQVFEEGRVYHCWIKYKTRCDYLVSFFFEKDQSVASQKLKLPEGVKLCSKFRTGTLPLVK